MKIGVLMGGCSSEREISLRSGTAVLAALQRQGIDAVAVELDRNWPETLLASRIECAFIALHGTWGEDGCVQGMLEMMEIPYTGSGVTASALCMNKRLCKDVLSRHGLQTPVDIPLQVEGPLRYPVIVKPVAEGSSVGLHHLTSVEEWQVLAIDDVQGWMAEMPVQGPEIAVAVLHGEALPPVEVAPHSGVYDFQSKYTPGSTDYFCPARLPAEMLGYCMEAAETAVAVTGCKGASRVDMIISDGGQPVILEINTIPGMTETSLLPKSAAQAGISFDDLCLQILAQATREHEPAGGGYNVSP